MSLRAFVRRFGPALLMMAAIYIASDLPGDALPQGGGVKLIARKTGHVVGYALLGLAFFRALASQGVATPTLRTGVIAVALATGYGATDEFHQSFVPGRGPAVTDVLIDMVGASLGVGVRLLRQARRASGELPSGG